MINNGIVAPTATPMTTTLHALDTELAAPAAAVPPVPLPVVCFALGEAYGALYVRRLHDMLARHCPQPFTLYCYTDRPRQLPSAVVQRDCSGWTELEREGMRPTTRKLGIFNPAYVEFESFLYLDLTLVIRRDMGELLAFAFARPEPLVIVPSWYHEGGYNSSVMRLRRGELKAVYDAFVAGERFVQNVAGDQDFILGVVRSRGLEDRIARFPPHQVISFRKTLKAGGRDPAWARRRMEDATIVKFHGRPKMNEAFSARYHWRLRLRELLRGCWRPVMPVGELRRQWHGSETA